MKTKKKKIDKSKEKVRFVSYDGKWPNLCSGTLVLKVGDKKFVFPKYCMRSGGSVWFSNGYAEEHVEHGDWSISDWPERFPENLKDEAERIVNDNVGRGCCGGCL